MLWTRSLLYVFRSLQEFSVRINYIKIGYILKLFKISDGGYEAISSIMMYSSCGEQTLSTRIELRLRCHFDGQENISKKINNSPLTGLPTIMAIVVAERKAPNQPGVDFCAMMTSLSSSLSFLSCNRLQMCFILRGLFGTGHYSSESNQHHRVACLQRRCCEELLTREHIQLERGKKWTFPDVTGGVPWRRDWVWKCT